MEKLYRSPQFWRPVVDNRDSRMADGNVKFLSIFRNKMLRNGDYDEWKKRRLYKLG